MPEQPEQPEHSSRFRAGDIQKLVALLRHGAVCQERLAGPSASPIGWTIGEGRKELCRQQQAGWRVRRARAGASQQLAAVSCLVQIC